MTYLLDTDTLIHLLRGLRIDRPTNASQRERQAVARSLLARCRQRMEDGDILGVSAITVAELEHGARAGGPYERESAAVRKLLTPFLAFSFDAVHGATAYGEVRHELEDQGRPIGAMDLLIAAHAKALGAVLVTGNLAHFQRVTGLRCESWLSS
jgi:tRNA(fMet)-specific endonuclease VapC